MNLILYPTFHNVIVKYSITWHISKKKILGAIRPTIHIFTYILLHFYSIYTEHSKESDAHTFLTRTFLRWDSAEVHGVLHEACTFVRMSLSLYEPHKVPLSAEQTLYLHCALPTTNREREGKRSFIHCLCASLYVYHCRWFRLLNACNVEPNNLKKWKKVIYQRYRAGGERFNNENRPKLLNSREIINNWFDV